MTHTTTDNGPQTTTSTPEATNADPVVEARLAGMLRSWWLDERPAWTDPGWWDAPVRDEVRRLLWLPAGPDLAAGLSDLPRGGSCPAPHTDDRVLPGFPTPGHAPGWPCACQVVTAAGWDACAAWVAASAAEALIDAAGPAPVAFTAGGQQIHDPARDELAPALRSTTASMGNRITGARSLLAHPALVHLLATGAVSGWAARVVVREVDTLDPDQAATVVTAVCDRISTRSRSSRRAYNSAEVARITRTTRLRLAGPPDQHVRARAHAQRRVQVLPGTDGMATLIADLAETDAHRIHHRLTALTAALRADLTGQHDPRTRDQQRADTLVDLLLGTGTQIPLDHNHATPTTRDLRTGTGPTPAPGQAPGIPAHGTPAHDTGPDTSAPGQVPPRRPGSGHPDVQVIITLDTLLGMTQDPAHIPGLGPIPADIARTLAADGRWTAWITDATNTIQSTGTRSYTPTASLARLVRARHPHCRFPGCRQPATRCDLDHATAWPHGPTTTDNLGPLCRRHHNLKTHTGWTLHPNPNPKSPEQSARTPDSETTSGDQPTRTPETTSGDRSARTPEPRDRSATTRESGDQPASANTGSGEPHRSFSAE